MSTTKGDKFSCPGCGEVALPWDAKDSHDDEFGGRYCRSCGWHSVLRAPWMLTLTRIWREYDDAIAIAAFVAVVMLGIVIVIFPFTESRVTYCYAAHDRASEVVSGKFCLYGHEDWRTDRKLRCEFTAIAEAVQFAHDLQCPMEHEVAK